MGKPSPPKSPDYAAAATAQGAANVDAAKTAGIINNPNINSPYGSQTVTWDPATGQPTINQSLNPTSQQILDASQRAQLGMANIAGDAAGRIGGLLGSSFSLGNNMFPPEVNLPQGWNVEMAPSAGGFMVTGGAGNGRVPNPGQFGMAAGMPGWAMGQYGGGGGFAPFSFGGGGGFNPGYAGPSMRGMAAPQLGGMQMSRSDLGQAPTQPAAAPAPTLNTPKPTDAQLQAVGTDPNNYRQQQSRAADILANNQGDDFYKQKYGVTRDQFIASQNINPANVSAPVGSASPSEIQSLGPAANPAPAAQASDSDNSAAPSNFAGMLQMGTPPSNIGQPNPNLPDWAKNQEGTAAMGNPINPSLAAFQNFAGGGNPAPQETASGVPAMSAPNIGAQPAMVGAPQQPPQFQSSSSDNGGFAGQIVRPNAPNSGGWNAAGGASAPAPNLGGMQFQRPGTGYGPTTGFVPPAQAAAMGAPQPAQQPAPSGGSGLAQTGLNESGVPNMPVSPGMTAQNAIMSRLAPQLQQQRTSAETELINQGLRPGSEAYDNAYRLLNQQQNDQLTQAALQGLGLDFQANNQGFNQALQRGQFGNQAIGQNFGQGLQAQQLANAAQAQNFNQAMASQGEGFSQAQAMEAARNQASQQNYNNLMNWQQAQNAAQNQLFNQNLQRYGFYNTGQNQMLAQMLQLRELPLNEISALLSGSQIQNPQFQPYQGQNVQASPVFQGAQAQGQWNQNLYNQQMASRNALMGGLFGLGGAAMGLL